VCSYVKGNFNTTPSLTSPTRSSQKWEEGLDRTPAPANFPRGLEKQDVAYQFIDASEGSESQRGRWARGPSVDGNGQFTYTKIAGLRMTKACWARSIRGPMARRHLPSLRKRRSSLAANKMGPAVGRCCIPPTAE
jgi:hypothetical protein